VRCVRCRLKCTKPPLYAGDGLQRSRSSVVVDTRRRDSTVGRKLQSSQNAIDDLGMTAAINREFCPPSQLRSSVGLAFRPAKQPQWKPVGRPSSGRTADGHERNDWNVMEQSLYDNVPSTSDNDQMSSDGGNEQSSLSDGVQLRHSLSNASDTHEKRRSGLFNAVYGQQPSSDQRSESWLWNQRELVAQTKPGFVIKATPMKI
jgi:hypothetical protein